MTHDEIVAELKRQRCEIEMLREVIDRKDRRITELENQLAIFKGQRRGD